MRARLTPAAAFVLVAALAVAPACTSFDGAAAPSDDGGTPPPEAGTSSADADVPDAPYEPPPPCDAAEAPGAGVYVSAAFGLPGGLGTSATPLKSIAAGLDAAAAAGATRVYVDEGTYPEALKFDDRHVGIVVEGGWKGSEAGWRRDCAEGFRARTIVESPELVGVTVEVTKPGAASGLASLTVTTRAPAPPAPAAPGETTVGVLVRGPASFRLATVKVVAARGGAGGAVPPATGQVASAACGACASGAAGTPAPAAPSGRAAAFTDEGFAPGDGAEGAGGGTGLAGTPGGAGQTSTCAVQTTGQCNDAVNPPFCGFINGTISATPGRCGCGGAGGAGGGAGRGGGASVALLVLGEGTVALDHANLTAVGGGAGSPGGAGAEGAAGEAGRAGTNATCFTASMQSGAQGPACSCQLASPKTLLGGPTGGRGGAGGKGAAGSGGAGGPAHAWVVVGGAGSPGVLADPATVLVAGPGGAGAGAPAGESAPSKRVAPP